MKLIDILVQELPKRGGWPEGIEEIWQDYDNLIRAGAYGWFHDELSEDHRRQHHDAHVKVGRKQYEAALAASKVPVWDGEGLPPIGCECEVKRGDAWLSVTILFISAQQTVLKMKNGIESCSATFLLKFRPLRTEAELKREEAGLAIYHAINWAVDGEIANHSRMEDYRKAYDAIAAGKIPGIRLTDDTGSQ